MSLKENIEMVKEELNSEEKFFEKAVITEKFVKKYKKLMIASVVAIVIVVVANVVINSNKAATIVEANEVFAKLVKDKNDKNALTAMKSLSPMLYDAWNYSQAMVNKDVESMKKLQSSKATLISDLATYEVASQGGASSKLNTYSMKQGAIYKDLAIVQSAIILLNSNEVDKAHDELKKISQNSSLSKIVLALLHYGVK